MEIRIHLGAVVVTPARDTRRQALVGKARQFVDLPGIRSYGREFRHGAFHKHSKLKEVAHLLQAHLRNKVAPAGHDFEQMLVMQAVASLAEWRAPDTISLHDFFFSEEHAFFDFASHNSFLDA